MVAYPHLEHAPITEAVLNIQVEPVPTEALPGALDAFAGATAIDYPEPAKINKVAARLGDDGVTAGPVELHGNIYWNVGHTRAVQARLDGFSVNHVGDYKDWETLRAEAKSWWSRYRDAFRPARVTRCSLRYINRIQVKPYVEQLESVFSMRLDIGSRLPQNMEEYFVRVALPFGEDRRAFVTQATAPSDGPERSVFLDIEAFVERGFEPASNDLWVEFDALREIKNACFFGTLTPEKVETYK